MAAVSRRLLSSPPPSPSADPQQAEDGEGERIWFRDADEDIRQRIADSEFVNRVQSEIAGGEIDRTGTGPGPDGRAARQGVDRSLGFGQRNIDPHVQFVGGYCTGH